jgi:hypothetical protein
MKWISLSKSNADVRVFNMVEANKVKEVLKYNPLQQSLRLSSIERQRVFFIQQAGFRHNHFIFKNEYGFDTGRIFVDTANDDSGIIEYEQTKMQYALVYNPSLEMVIYEADGLTPMAVCELQQENNRQIAFSLNNKETFFGYACLLWGLCWYTCSTAGNETTADYKKELTLA